MRAPTAFLAAALAVAVSLPGLAAGQAFTPPEGVGSVTFSWQYIDNTGHRGTDGFFVARGESVTSSLLVEADYGITDRLNASVGLPYVFAKYTGAQPPFSRLPVDICGCWHSSLQDLSLGTRYRLGTDTWAVTPSVRYGVPTHDYPYRGEAVVGRHLKELQVGVSAGLKLAVLPGASVQAGYMYSFTERALDDIKVDRSSGFMDLGYALTRSVFLRGSANWQVTHGGLRAGSASGTPFPLPGELNTPERIGERDRLIRSHYWHVGGGIAYSLGPADVFAGYTKYLWGRDTHNGQAFTVGSTWYFDLGN